MIDTIAVDPSLAGAFPAVLRAPAAAERPRTGAHFRFFGELPEQPYAPGSDGFVFWQCREVVHQTVALWEALDEPLRRWARSPFDGRRRLNVDPGAAAPAGEAPAGRYSGRALVFDRALIGGATVAVGASVDVVSHETGHALLDAVRPELFDSPLPEVAAFHESYADCIALLLMLHSPDVRRDLLAAVPRLDGPNFVESLMSYAAEVIRSVRGDVDGSRPRHALNDLVWQLPATLPAGGVNDPPDRLTRQPHSFGRVFTGCFYDVLRGLFEAETGPRADALGRAAQTAGRLLARAGRTALLTERFFQSAGQAMVLADDALFGGAHRRIVGDAFARHGVLLGSSALTAPHTLLEGPAPAARARSAALAPSTRADLRERAAGAGRSLRVERAPFGARALVRFERTVALGALDRTLRGVTARVCASGLVVASAARAALAGPVPDAKRTEDEVRCFVESLLSGGGLRPGARRRGPRETHSVRSTGGRRRLSRRHFR